MATQPGILEVRPEYYGKPLLDPQIELQKFFNEIRGKMKIKILNFRTRHFCESLDSPVTENFRIFKGSVTHLITGTPKPGDSLCIYF
jgi:hypothetical protein